MDEQGTPKDPAVADGERPAVGDIVGGRWRIDRPITSGGLGGVFAATDTSSAVTGGVAVKVLLTGTSMAERRNFLSEVRQLAAVQHPNLASYLDAGLLEEERGGAVFLVTELCDESLHDFCRRHRGGLLPAEQLPALIAHVGAGLDHLHRSGRIHNDLKPSNILRSGNQWKLADFGLVGDLRSSGVDHHDRLAGTSRYRAPEFFLGDPVGPAADIWSIGVVTHETMTGAGVHGGQGTTFIHNVTGTEPTISSSLQPNVVTLVRRCLAADPGLRPPAAELHPLLAGLGPPEPESPSVAPPVSPAVSSPNSASVSAASSEPSSEAPAVSPQAQPVTGERLAPSSPASTAAVGVGANTPAPVPGGGRALVLLSLVAGLVLFAVVAASIAWTGGDDELASEPAGPLADVSESAGPLADASEVAGSVSDASEVSGGDGVVSEGDRPGRSVAFDQFSVGDCVDAATLDGRLIPNVIRACDAAHSYEVIGLLEHPDAGGDFPGDDVLFEYGSASCREAFESRLGVDAGDTRLQVVSFQPNADDWSMARYNVICVVNRGDLEPLTMPLGQNADQWIWTSGDSLNLLELQLERCFDVANGLVEVGLTIQRVIYRDCDEPHDGEHFLNTFLQDLEGEADDPYPGETLLLDEANRRCNRALREQYGTAFPLRSTAVVATEQEWTRFGAKLAACVVVTSEPFSESLASMADG